MRSIAWVVLVAACHSNGGGVGDPAVDAFVGNDTPAGSPAVLFAMPVMADFGNVAVGVHSAPIHFTILNMGGATSLNVGTGSPYMVASTTCTTSLGDHAMCTVDVVVTPLATGVVGGELHAIGVGTALARAPLAALGVPNDGRLTITPAAHDFGNQAVGQTSAITTFTVMNPSATAVGPLGVSSGGTDPTNFVLASDTCMGATVLASGTCTFTVAFAPASTGAKSAKVIVTSSSNTILAVTGSGI